MYFVPLIAEQAGRKSIKKYRTFAMIEFKDFIGISTTTDEHG
jgi:hypothetical protein